MKTIIEMAREAGFAINELHCSPPIITFVGQEGVIEAFAALVRADERKAIYDQWHSCVMADLENGVKWLNEKAAAEWHKNYPAQSKMFPEWIEARGRP
jgi:hypothetical protein